MHCPLLNAMMRSSTGCHIVVSTTWSSNGPQLCYTCRYLGLRVHFCRIVHTQTFVWWEIRKRPVSPDFCCPRYSWRRRVAGECGRPQVQLCQHAQEAPDRCGARVGSTGRRLVAGIYIAIACKTNIPSWNPLWSSRQITPFTAHFLFIHFRTTGWIGTRTRNSCIFWPIYLQKMLKFRPGERISASEAMRHPYFSECDGFRRLSLSSTSSRLSTASSSPKSSPASSAAAAIVTTQIIQDERPWTWRSDFRIHFIAPLWPNTNHIIIILACRPRRTRPTSLPHPSLQNRPWIYRVYHNICTVHTKMIVRITHIF